jgi:hypothetical protein
MPSIGVILERKTLTVGVIQIDADVIECINSPTSYRHLTSQNCIAFQIHSSCCVWSRRQSQSWLVLAEDSNTPLGSINGNYPKCDVVLMWQSLEEGNLNQYLVDEQNFKNPHTLGPFIKLCINIHRRIQQWRNTKSLIQTTEIKTMGNDQRLQLYDSL